MTNTITVHGSSTLLSNYNLTEGQLLTESEAYDLINKVNNDKSSKVKLMIENNQLKIRSLIVG